MADQQAKQPDFEEWPAPWRGWLGRDELCAFARELGLECAGRDPLSEVSVELLGRSDAQDDLLVGFEDGRVAVVHLTWSGHVEPDGYPRARFFVSRAAWLATARLAARDFD